ncbi:MAG TPA: HAD family hydrolase [Novosphingobium sp.]|nr:HAD family hydrolase [Novosphingobium sp.]
MHAITPGRPLVITDCDEVLLHMVGPFAQWLAETQGVTFTMNGNDFSRAMRRADTGDALEQAEMWRLLGAFFDTEMHRQQPIAGAFAAMRAAAEVGHVVVLTNLEHHRNEARTRQLADLGLPLRVFTNQGPKGPAIRAILEEYRPLRAVFIDDIAQHHGSAAQETPHVARLHLCGEPRMAPHISCAHQAGHAHARIDDWAKATPWLIAQLNGDI